MERRQQPGDDLRLREQHDANGNRASLTEGTLNFGYAYDALNRLRKASDSLGNSIVFDYDLDGRRTSVTRPNGVKTTYAYDAASQVTSISHAKAGAVLLAFFYGGGEVHGYLLSRQEGDEDDNETIE